MANLLCACGNILSDTCGTDAEVFTEDQITDSDYPYECYLPGDGRSILECEKCGALAIEDPIGSNMVIFYLPDNDKFNKLFKGK